MILVKRPLGPISMEGSRFRRPEAPQTPPGAASGATPGFVEGGFFERI